MEPTPFFLAKFTLFEERMGAFPELIWDRPSLTALRSVLMKPEHLAAVAGLHERVVSATVAITNES
ncbi:MAG: hypothetical protein R2845_06000 [Thermomicrobiales bacterium]